jgi:hypothetical protein
LLISGLLNPHKYLANYMAPNITCSVLWGRKYGILLFSLLLVVKFW